MNTTRAENGRNFHHGSSSLQRRRELAPRRITHCHQRRGSPQAQDAEGSPDRYNMELLLPPIAGTLTLFMVQLIEFVRREHSMELTSGIRTVITVAVVLFIHLAAIRFVFPAIGTV